MKKEKDKVDFIEIETRAQRDGYIGFGAWLKYKGNLVTYLMGDDISHKKFTEQVYRHIEKKYQFVRNDDNNAETAPKDGSCHEITSN